MNIIYGHAKRVLNAQGHDLQKAIPSIILGKNLQTSHLTDAPVVVLPFKSNSGEFYIEIGVGDTTVNKVA